MYIFKLWVRVSCFSLHPGFMHLANGIQYCDTQTLMYQLNLIYTTDIDTFPAYVADTATVFHPSSFIYCFVLAKGDI